MDSLSTQTDTSEFWLPHLLPHDTGEVVYLQLIADLSNTDSENLKYKGSYEDLTYRMHTYTE